MVVSKPETRPGFEFENLIRITSTIARGDDREYLSNMLLEFPFKYFVSCIFHLSLTKYEQKNDEVTDERIVYF